MRAGARSLGITQPALTKSLKQLEEELGVALFERSIRGMQASAYGKAFAHRAKVVELELQRGVEEIRQMQGLYSGSVSIGVSPSPAIELLPQVLKRFHSRHPSVSVRLIDGQYPFFLPSLRDGSTDFVIGPRPPEGLDSEFLSEMLYLNHNMIVCRKGHPLAGATSIRDLKDVEWVLPNLTRGPSIAIFELFRQLNLGTPKCNTTSEFIMATQSIVAATDKFTAAPAGAMKKGAFRADLVGVKIKEKLRPAEICLIKRADRPLTPAAQELADYFRRTLVADT